MKKTLPTRVGTFAFVMLVACNQGQRDGAKTALDIGKTICIIANAMLPDSKVAEICGIADPFIQPMKDVLSEQRQKVAAARAEERAAMQKLGCGSMGADAGVK